LTIEDFNEKTQKLVLLTATCNHFSDIFM